MELGSFSVSLAVKDLEKSKQFYLSLGFEQVGGDGDHYLIMRNGDTNIGLFEGMFDANILTFNPGWDQQGSELDEFTDIRELQQRLKDQGLSFSSEADPASTGPASFVISDPDGNTILVDQHR